MSTTDQNDYPRICSEVGLTCETCTSSTATQLAAVCKGLRGKMVGQLFVQLYPNPACSRMHSYFADAYQAASAEPAVRRAPQPQPSYRRVAMAAIA